MQNRRKRLNLPFVKRRTDPVTWIYEHRAGVFSLVAFTLVMAILFIGSRIIVRTPRHDDAILVQIQTVEELREETRRLQRENRMLQSAIDRDNISNAVSNEGAELRDDRNTNAASMRDEIEQTNQNLRGNRDAWDQGLRDIESMRGERDGEGDKNTGNDSRAKGRVLVEFSLSAPLRTGVDVPAPGYRCERFGEVVIDITVDRNGMVTAAKVNAASTDNDLCMRETALNYARRSRFNIDSSAPERHTGTITYTFVAQ